MSDRAQPRRLLVAAVSFEDRCVGALRSLLDDTSDLEAAFLDYGANATPGVEAQTLRSANWERLEEICSRFGVPLRRISLPPYAMGPLEQYLEARLGEYSEIVVDISCLTRPHVLAAAVTVSNSENASWRIAYTSPRSYGDLNAPHGYGGWHETLLLPLGPDPSLSREGVALGILLVGHEASRAGIAFEELEPATGLVVGTVVADRPDLFRRAMSQNRSLLSHLASLKMPGPEGRNVLPYFPTGGWDIETVDFSCAIDNIHHVSQRVLEAARTLSAPIVLYPFGPKIIVFCFGALLARSYPEASWAMYPVPRTHPVTYSDGIGATSWLAGSDVAKL